ncbi:MAG: nucleotide exchange factor GrpE [Bacteroidales bacterium]
MNREEMDNKELHEEIENNNLEVEQNELNEESSCEEDKLAADIVAIQEKNRELNDQYLRLMADYDNYRKRTMREKAELIKNGGETTLVNILPVVDDFERALANIEKAQDIEAVKEGINLIYGKFIAYLKQNNVVEIETAEQPFDTDLHDAITTIPAPSEELKGKVIDCIQKGYKLNDKVIRFSKVVVGE